MCEKLFFSFIFIRCRFLVEQRRRNLSDVLREMITFGSDSSLSEVERTFGEVCCCSCPFWLPPRYQEKTRSLNAPLNCMARSSTPPAAPCWGFGRDRLWGCLISLYVCSEIGRLDLVGWLTTLPSNFIWRTRCRRRLRNVRRQRSSVTMGWRTEAFDVGRATLALVDPLVLPRRATDPRRRRRRILCNVRRWRALTTGGRLSGVSVTGIFVRYKSPLSLEFGVIFTCSSFTV